MRGKVVEVLQKQNNCKNKILLYSVAHIFYFEVRTQYILTFKRGIVAKGRLCNSYNLLRLQSLELQQETYE